MLGVPFVSAEATSLAQTRYVNEEMEAILQRLVDKANGSIADAQSGIVFIDEIDKLKASNAQSQAVSGESVHHALLKIMEGALVRLKGERYLDTRHILFIYGGSDNQNILDRLNKRVKPSDLFEFGLIPEFTGRLPIIASFQNLSKEMLVRVMSEPQNSIYQQYVEIFRNEGVELSIAPLVFEQIAEIAIEYKTGTRSLRGILAWALG